MAVWHPYNPTRPQAALADLQQISAHPIVWLNEAVGGLLDPCGHRRALIPGLGLWIMDVRCAPAWRSLGWRVGLQHRDAALYAQGAAQAGGLGEGVLVIGPPRSFMLGAEQHLDRVDPRNGPACQI